MEPLDAPLSFLFVQVQDCLRIAPRSVPMPSRFKPGTEGSVVIDLAVVDDPDALVLVRERLMAAGYVDDREPPVSQSDRSLDP